MTGLSENMPATPSREYVATASAGVLQAFTSECQHPKINTNLARKHASIYQANVIVVHKAQLKLAMYQIFKDFYQISIDPDSRIFVEKPWEYFPVG